MNKHNYPCLHRKHKGALIRPKAVWVAKNNNPIYGHLCQPCFAELKLEEKADYGYVGFLSQR